jgi:hypothetical protein
MEILLELLCFCTIFMFQTRPLSSDVGTSIFMKILLKILSYDPNAVCSVRSFFPGFNNAFLYKILLSTTFYHVTQ